jgi:hypothetical protein
MNNIAIKHSRTIPQRSRRKRSCRTRVAMLFPLPSIREEPVRNVEQAARLLDELPVWRTSRFTEREITGETPVLRFWMRLSPTNGKNCR